MAQISPALLRSIINRSAQIVPGAPSSPISVKPVLRSLFTRAGDEFPNAPPTSLDQSLAPPIIEGQFPRRQTIETDPEALASVTKNMNDTQSELLLRMLIARLGEQHISPYSVAPEAEFVKRSPNLRSSSRSLHRTGVPKNESDLYNQYVGSNAIGLSNIREEYKDPLTSLTRSGYILKEPRDFTRIDPEELLTSKQSTLENAIKSRLTGNPLGEPFNPETYQPRTPKEVKTAIFVKEHMPFFRKATDRARLKTIPSALKNRDVQESLDVLGVDRKSPLAESMVLRYLTDAKSGQIPVSLARAVNAITLSKGRGPQIRPMSERQKSSELEKTLQQRSGENPSELYQTESLRYNRDPNEGVKPDDPDFPSERRNAFNRKKELDFRGPTNRPTLPTTEASQSSRELLKVFKEGPRQSFSSGDIAERYKARELRMKGVVEDSTDEGSGLTRKLTMGSPESMRARILKAIRKHGEDLQVSPENIKPHNLRKIEEVNGIIDAFVGKETQIPGAVEYVNKLKDFRRQLIIRANEGDNVSGTQIPKFKEEPNKGLATLSVEKRTEAAGAIDKPPTIVNKQPTSGGPSTTSKQPITKLQGTFLSNFHPVRIEHEGITYPSVEHAYQASKSSDPVVRKRIASAMSPGQAKKLGRNIDMRSGWNASKVAIMKELVRRKFSDEKLASRLVSTGDANIVEGNTWGDKFWGVSNGEGRNELGKILMEVRDELRRKRGSDG